MLKKLLHFKGFILLESLLSLTIFFLVITTFSLSCLHFLKQAAKYDELEKMQRYAYEVMKEYEAYGGRTNREVYDGAICYRIKITRDSHHIKGITVSNGKEQFTVEK